MSTPSASWVVLSMGDRPRELAAAVESIGRQADVEPEVLVVANGADVPAPSGAGVLRLADNAGIPAGRNAGVRHTTGDIVFFLDDDACYADEGLASAVVAAFAAAPDLGIVSLRLRDPATGRTERRHIPRLGRSDPDRSSDVTTFLGGASAVRRKVFEDVGGFPDEFFYSHEETDLAWRALDAGWRIEYRADLEVLHPAQRPQRHDEYHRRSSRNRVWLARRRLPWVVAAIYVAVWSVISTLRSGSPAAARDVWRGIGEGLRADPGARVPMRWRTVWRMTMLGRPPII
ncbi:MAG TPA: glycosyltransferase [Acidimicrobiia bacterium]